ncbi:DUF6503 family protein [Pontimicrobium sp. IMCC45349]|uniref:DUF6503 family protein n=1 Tax=Pontimicrobium sp. IMCC45349 TaxID=3391574 RepID=UPI0039A34A47
MKPFSLLLILTFLVSCNKPLKGNELLDKAISYHDPNNNWSAFNGAFNVTMETPNQSNRITNIKINLPQSYFFAKATRDTITTVFEVNNNDCKVSLNGKTELTEEEIKTHRLDCERANMYKNYYTYLFGLPMKLKDPGTNIHETVETKTFKGKEYLVIKATYDANVGSDIWYFYFDPETYAMEIYQFFKTDDSGKQKDDSGEYILLTEETIVNDIKMPKNRAWYYNKDDKYLGTDILN